MRSHLFLAVLITSSLCGQICRAQDTTCQFRRVVTGHTKDGMSVVVSDGQAPRVVTLKSWPGLASAEIWATAHDASVPTDSNDPSITMSEFLPETGGTRFRIVCLPPNSPTDGEAFWKEYRKQVTGAVLDRLTHRCHILEASGESYRLKDARRRSQGKKAAETPPKPASNDQTNPTI